MSQFQDSLTDRINNRSATIGVVGLGYVGQPLVLRFSDMGFRVLGLDVNEAKVADLNAGHTHIEHIPDARIGRLRDQGFEASADFSRATEVDALILCVPTPLGPHREPDLHYVTDTVDTLAPHLRAGQVLSLESTTYPGTTEEEVRPRLETQGFTVGGDIFVVYSPEREDPANPDYSTQTIPKVVGGLTPTCREVGAALYEQIVDTVVPVSSPRAAEMTKLLENIHRAVNIGLVNEMKIVADHMGIDIYEVIEAAATKPFGFVPYMPGPGLGGHCIPIDPFYLTWKAREYGVDTRFIELAGEVNRSMPGWVVDKVMEGLNRHRKPVNGSRILILGVAYKKNVDDMRESPALEIMEQLQDHGADLAYSDPHVPRFPELRKHHFDLANTPLTAENLAAQDCVVLVTDHDAYDYDLICNHAPLIVDTRGVLRETGDNIIRA